MDKASLVFSVFGLVGLAIVGRQIAIVYMAATQVFENHVRGVLSAFLACFFMLIGLMLAGLSLSYVLTKSWPLIAHFMLLACLCAVSGYLMLIPARKRAKAVAQSKAKVASARVEPTVDPVAQATPAVAPASAEPSASVAPVAAASAVAATAAAVAATAPASEIDESSLPDAPAPAVISGINDDVLDSWTPDEDEVEVAAPAAPAAPVVHVAHAEPAVESEVVASAVVPELEPQGALLLEVPADSEEPAFAVQPEVPVAAVSPLVDEPADVLDLNEVVLVSGAVDSVNAEHRVEVVEPASDTEVARPVVASSSVVPVAVA